MTCERCGSNLNPKRAVPVRLPDIDLTIYYGEDCWCRKNGKPTRTERRAARRSPKGGAHGE